MKYYQSNLVGVFHLYETSTAEIREMLLEFHFLRGDESAIGRYREVYDTNTLNRATNEIRQATGSNFTAQRAYLLSMTEFKLSQPTDVSYPPTLQVLVARDTDLVYATFVFHKPYDVMTESHNYDYPKRTIYMQNDWLKTWLLYNKDLYSAGAYVLPIPLNAKKIELYPYGEQSGDETKPSEDYHAFNRSLMDEVENEMTLFKKSYSPLNAIKRVAFPNMKEGFYIACSSRRRILDLFNLTYRETSDNFTLLKATQDIRTAHNLNFYPTKCVVITMNVGFPINNVFQIVFAINGETIYSITRTPYKWGYFQYYVYYKYCKFFGHATKNDMKASVSLVTRRKCPKPVTYPFEGRYGYTHSTGRFHTFSYYTQRPVPFFTLMREKLFVNAKGFVSNEESLSTETTVMSFYKGTISKALTTEYSESYRILQQASKDVQAFSSNNFTAKHAFLIVTSDFGEGNYAQLVLVTDKNQTYAILNYEGELINEGYVGYYERLCIGKTYAAGNESKKLVFTSNINVPGRHVIRLTPDRCSKTSLFPYGSAANDTKMKRGDNIAEKVVLKTPVPFYTKMEDTFYISVNGLISIGIPVTWKLPKTANFKLYPGNKYLYPGNVLTPYHTNLDTTHSGAIYYRETQEPDIISSINTDLNSFFNFSSTRYAFIVTYIDVPKHNAQHEKNSFQIILAHDGVNHSYVMYKYTQLNSVDVHPVLLSMEYCLVVETEQFIKSATSLVRASNTNEQGKIIAKIQDGGLCDQYSDAVNNPDGKPEAFQLLKLGYDFASFVWKKAMNHPQQIMTFKKGDWEGKSSNSCPGELSSYMEVLYLRINQTYHVELLTESGSSNLELSTKNKLDAVKDVHFTQDGTKATMDWNIESHLIAEISGFYFSLTHRSTDNDELIKLNFTSFDVTYSFNGTIGSVHYFEITTWLHNQASSVKNATYTFTEESKSDVSELIIIISLSSAAFVIILVLTVLFYYKRKKAKRKANRFLLSHGSNKIDPDRSILEQCNNLYYDPKFEFPRHNIYLLKVLGEGTFGQVWMASAAGLEWFRPRANKTKKSAIKKALSTRRSKKVVAVKTLKGNATDAEYKDLANELKLLIHIGEHRNIVNLLGACTKGEDLLVLLEYCANGALLSYVRLHRDDFELNWHRLESKEVNWYQLTWIGVQVADGMNFLEQHNCVHRDLAARNVLLNDEMVVKVADFGLARDTTGENYYKKESEGMLPMKWMAPEAIVDQKYTSKSDVWSYGVLLWEMFSLGLGPYPGIQNEDVLKYIKTGRRMEKPKNCPDDVYEIMLQCWSVAVDLRPTFINLRNMMDGILLKNEESFHSKHTMASLYKINYAPKKQTNSNPRYTNTLPVQPAKTETNEIENEDLYLTLGADGEAPSTETKETLKMAVLEENDENYIVPENMACDTDSLYLVMNKEIE
ncbi:uncharacterized protein LOC130625556 isoform X2 [Hydractinia symbiolongicarpus]|nr:uncharacterized protein LOC130625556 isoform X2 [Hydractinia symbiolongicarpus]